MSFEDGIKLVEYVSYTFLVLAGVSFFSDLLKFPKSWKYALMGAIIPIPLFWYLEWLNNINIKYIDLLSVLLGALVGYSNTSADGNNRRTTTQKDKWITVCLFVSGIVYLTFINLGRILTIIISVVVENR